MASSTGAAQQGTLWASHGSVIYRPPRKTPRRWAVVIHHNITTMPVVPWAWVHGSMVHGPWVGWSVGAAFVRK